jgi:hypothetical protein
MCEKLFINNLTNKVFKILPLKEDKEQGYDVYLDDYIDSLYSEIIGATKLFPDLKIDPDFITVATTVGYLSTNDFTIKKCKKEVFKMTRLLNQIESKYGG